MNPLAVWDVLEGLADDGQRYTTLRHATLGLAVELWHDSMGAFHLYLPSDRPKAESAVMCCFSSGIVVQEDTLCAPELLLELCQHCSCFETHNNGGGAPKWTRDPNLCLGSEGLQIWDSNGDRSWEVKPDGASRLSNGAEAANTIVISHALTQSEIVLFYAGLIFVGGEPLLLPCSGTFNGSANVLHDANVEELLHELELSGTQAPSDPVQLQGRSQPAGIAVSYSWNAYDPVGPSKDAVLRHRLSLDALSSQGARQRRLRHSGQQPQDPGAMAARFCGAWSKWGACSGLVSVSGHLQAVSDEPFALPGGGSADGGREHAEALLRRQQTGLLHFQRPQERRQDGSVDQGYCSGEMEWCRRVGQDGSASEEDMEWVLKTVVANGWDHFFVTHPNPNTWRWIFAETDWRIDAVIDSADGSGCTPLMSACFHGHLAMVRVLLSRGADTNRVDFHGRTCLFHSLSPPPRGAEHADHDVGYKQQLHRKRAVTASLVELLLQYRANAEHADHKGVTPLRLAATAGLHYCADMLMRAGADPRRVDSNGFSVLASVEAQEWRASTASLSQRISAMLQILKRPSSALSTEQEIPAGAQQRSLASFPAFASSKDRSLFGVDDGNGAHDRNDAHDNSCAAHDRNDAHDNSAQLGGGLVGWRHALVASASRHALGASRRSRVHRQVRQREEETPVADARKMPVILALGGQGGKGLRWISVATAEDLVGRVRIMHMPKHAGGARVVYRPSANSDRGESEQGLGGPREQERLEGRELEPERIGLQLPAQGGPAYPIREETRCSGVQERNQNGPVGGGPKEGSRRASLSARRVAQSRLGSGDGEKGEHGREEAESEEAEAPEQAEATPESALPWAYRELVPVAELQTGMRVQVLLVGQEEGQEYHTQDALVLHACDQVAGARDQTAAGFRASPAHGAQPVEDKGLEPRELSALLTRERGQLQLQLQRMLTLGPLPTGAPSVPSSASQTKGAWAEDETLTVPAHCLTRAWKVCPGFSALRSLALLPPASPLWRSLASCFLLRVGLPGATPPCLLARLNQCMLETNACLRPMPA